MIAPKNAKLRLAALFLSTLLPAMFVAVVLNVASLPSQAQSLTTGGVSGNITDATGAVIPNATVTLTSLDSGAVQTATTNGSGEYRFSLLKPGRYTVSSTAIGFEKVERALEVSVGQVVTSSLILQVGQAATTVEVSAAVPLVNDDPAQITTFTQQQMELLPSGGGDLTNIAFTAPGAILNVAPPGMSGYGNFSINGLPGTSNLFTTNGENNMDPYFNINNSGASNLTLGSNEIQEVTITTNPYSGQFGQLSGAQVSYVTKSGTNQIHGNAEYYWNGRIMNANDFFNNTDGTPTAFANANQWADSIGGPIIKDKTFFFLDNEGLKFLLPNVDVIQAPSPAFASAVLANIQATQPNEAATYGKMLSLYQNIPGYSNGTLIPGSCTTLTSLPGFTDQPGFNANTSACTTQFQTTPSALASEWILAGRIDHRFSDKDQAYFRYKQDHGTQPTSISPVSSNFDAISVQPSWDTQLNETHIFSPNATNSFMATLSYYQAQFTQNQSLASSTFPYGLLSAGGFSTFNPIYEFPQGRNITQYQFIDDFSYSRGNHTFKVGENFRRYDISDHNFFFNSPAVYFSTQQEFAEGQSLLYIQNDNLANDVPIATWGLGVYAQDEWRIRPNLKITIALRGEHNSNPVCQTNCFTTFNAPFADLASTLSTDPGDVPYSADLKTGQHYAFPGVDTIDWSPRLGFSYSPFKSGKTIISGGAGMFYDNAPAGLVDQLLGNPPSSVQFVLFNQLPFDTTSAGAAAAFSSTARAFSISQTPNQLATATGGAFSAPNFTYFNGTIHSPVYQEWNFQIQQDVGGQYAVILAYNGNHGIKIPYQNNWYNAFDSAGLYPSSVVPTTQPNPNYGTVSSFQSGAVSNYNGATVTLRKRLSHGLTFDLNYTWAHGLDDVSNGGVFPINFNTSIGTQISPYGLRAENYGNSDYDIRNSLTGDWVYSPAYKFGNHFVNSLFGGWQWSGKVFLRSGLPFSVVDSSTTGLISDNGSSPVPVLAYPTASYSTSCGAAAANLGAPCLSASNFINPTSSSFTGYPGIAPQDRNQFRGPGYFDMDMQLYKTFKLTERLTFGLGAQAFNVFNHPNLSIPDNNVASGTFGQILSMAGTPTSPYGNFLGFDSGPRLVQITGKVTF
jgi:hypothetical protein